MVRWRGDARFFLVLASLCCVVSFSNGRVLPNLPSSPSARVGELERDGFESSAEFYRIVAEVPSTTKTDVEVVHFTDSVILQHLFCVSDSLSSVFLGFPCTLPCEFQFENLEAISIY